MDVSVIFSTYNAPKWLEKVIWGFAEQRYRDFELVIADDGSAAETRTLIERMRSELNLDIKHVWHEDNGFQKCQILNKAIVAAEGKYLVFTDGDCIPRSDFLETHVRMRQPGYFLSGGYCKLNMEGSERISRDVVASGQAFDPKYLESCGLKNRWNQKHVAQGLWVPVLNFFTPTKPTWNGHNASCWKEDALKINGFDERMVYGGQDREYGERLWNLGLKSKQIRYSAVCIHLDHARSYKNKEGIEFNKGIRENTCKTDVIRTPYGIEKEGIALANSK